MNHAWFPKVRHIRWSGAAVALLLMTALLAPTVSEGNPDIWFYPSPGSADYLALFSSRDWNKARAKVSVFGLASGQVSDPGRRSTNGLDSLVATDAFSRLKSWGIKIALSAPALKEWDCTGTSEVSITSDLIRTVNLAGAKVTYVDLDEPLVSALGRNKAVCNLSIMEAAKRVAKYGTDLMQTSGKKSSAESRAIVDTEAYPALSASELEEFVDDVGAEGLKLAALHLDINYDQLRLNQSLASRLRDDLRDLAGHLRKQGVRFGVIIWSGHDPEPSDKDYFVDSMDAVRRVCATNVHVDNYIFSSWVTRCSATGDCGANQFGCAHADEFCGHSSVPINLPEATTAYTHTRLILEALSLVSHGSD